MTTPEKVGEVVKTLTELGFQNLSTVPDSDSSDGVFLRATTFRRDLFAAALLRNGVHAAAAIEGVSVEEYVQKHILK
jgi:hypothetical protein